MEKKIIVNSPNEMIDLGKKIAKFVSKNMVLALIGDLGAGKTTLSKGIGQGLGITSIINSPTFTIMKIYEEGIMPLIHIDAYRITDNGDDFDLAEFLEINGLAVIEWAYNIKSLLSDFLEIKINILDEEKREVIFSSISKNYYSLINNL